MIIKKIWRIRLLAALLLVALLLGGCLPNPLRPEAPTKQSDTAELSQPSKPTQQQIAKEQQRFDTLMDELFKDQVALSQILLHFTLKNPENYGITECQTLFDDYTLETMLKDAQENKDLMKQLNSFNSQLLTGEQQRTYFILLDYLQTELLADGLELYNQPLSSTIGVQAQLPILLCEYYFDNRQDVENYLNLLANIDEYYNQLLAFYQQKSDAGLMPGDRAIDHIIDSCKAYILVPGDNFMSATFNTRLDAVPGLTDEEKSAYQERNLALLESDFVPAYQNLIDGLTKLKGTGKSDLGLASYPNGKRYYEHLAKSATGTSYDSIEALSKAMEAQLDDDIRIVGELIQSNPELVDQVYGYSFRLSEPTAILEDLKVQIQKDFPELPPCNYTIKYVPEALELTLSPAFYLTPPLDNPTDNSIYINGHSVDADSSNLYTVLAHEGYPGHLYQSVYFNNSNAPAIRHLLSYEGYSEGWASYVERYSYSLDNGMDPNLAQLVAANTFASLGLMATLDIYVNYEGWDTEKVSAYLAQYYAVPDAEVVQNIFDAMVENPSNYLSYYVGYLEMESMRKDAQETLKDRFVAKDFHKMILDIGPAPYSVIRSYFSSWLREQ